MADAVSILPDEVWKIILSHVEQDPNDLLSCYQTCTLFQSILLESQTSWLFPLVYPFLHNELKWDRKDVKSCRQVCRSWNKGVDTHMESHHFQPVSYPNPSWLRTKNLSGVPPLDDGLPVPRYGAIYPKKGHCEAFMADFKGSNRNPFISRTLGLSSISFPQALEFIKEFGRHVWALHLDVTEFASMEEEGITVTQLVKHLWDILEWVPCLKYLELDGFVCIHCSGDESDEDVEIFLETHKPPNLLNLLFLELFGWGDPPTQIYLQLRNIFIRHFQSRQVTILYDYDDSPRSYQELLLNLGWNMKSLSFTWNTASTYFQLHTQALSHINCPLESLDVNIKCYPDINQLGKLERLEISVTNKTIFLAEFDLKTLMGSWAEGNRAGVGGRNISKLGGPSSVNLLKKQEYWEIDDFECYPLCHEDKIRVMLQVEMPHLRIASW